MFIGQLQTLVIYTTNCYRSTIRQRHCIMETSQLLWVSLWWTTIKDKNAITGEKTQEGQLIVAFDEKLILPKGETYTLVIEKDAVANKDNPDETNDEIRLSFTIPTNLGEFNADIEDGSTLSKANLMTFYWGTETESDEQQAVLYREGVPVRQFPFQATWDWDLGQACVDFGEYIKIRERRKLRP